MSMSNTVIALRGGAAEVRSFIKRMCRRLLGLDTQLFTVDL
jgi:hypothetical protein